MTNTWVHGVEVNFCNSATVLAPGCLEQSAFKKGTPSPELVADSANGQRGDGPLISLGDHVSLVHKLGTWEPDCDGVSDEGSYPSIASSGSTDTDAGDWGFSEESDHSRGHVVDIGGSVTSFDTGSFESSDVAEDPGPSAGAKVAPCADGLVAPDKLSYALDLQQDGNGEFFYSEDNPAWGRPLGNQCSPSTSPLKALNVPQGRASVDKQLLSLAVRKDPSRFLSKEMDLYCSGDLVSSAHCPGPPLRGTGEYACESGETLLTTHLGSGERVTVAHTNGTSSSYASFQQPDDQAVIPLRRGDANVGFRDLEAGFKPGSLLLSGEQRASHEHDPSLNKDISYRVDGRSTNGHPVDREDGDLSSLRRRRGSLVEGHTRLSAIVAEGTRPSHQDGVVENGHEVKKAEKKCAKQLKARLACMEKEVSSMGAVKAGAGVRRMSGDALSADELRAKEQADNDRKVQESLDNFIRQTMGREPYMSFASRPSDRPLPRRSILPFKTVNESRDPGADDNLGGAVDSELLRDASGDSVRAGAGVARSLPLSGDRMNPFKVLQALVAFAQASGKADQLPAWSLSSNSTKPQLQKCAKVQCHREFISDINIRRHNRSHKKIFDSDKEDWNKSRPDIAAFWERKSPRERFDLFESLLVKVGHSDTHMWPSCLSAQGSSSGDYSVNKVVEALSKQQISLPVFYQNCGTDLLGMVLNERKEVSWNAEKLFRTFDSASEKTFLVGSADPGNNKVFSGDEKIGMEDKNLVSFLAFILEGALLKEWIKDKQTESLKYSNELVAEEEAFRKRQAENLERRRLKTERKLQERERKEISSALLSAETESHLQDTQKVVVDGDAQEDSPRSVSSGPMLSELESRSLGSGSRVEGGGAPPESAVAASELASLDIRSNVEGGDAQEDMAESPSFSVGPVTEGGARAGQLGSTDVVLSVPPPVVPDFITSDVQGASQASALEPTGLAWGLSQEIPLSRSSPTQLSSDAVEEKSVTTCVPSLSRAQESGFPGSVERGASSFASPSKQGKRAEGGSKIVKSEQDKAVVSDVRRPEADRSVANRKPVRKPQTDTHEVTACSDDRPVRGADGKSLEVAPPSTYRSLRKPNPVVPHPAKVEAVAHVPSPEPRSQHFRTVSQKVRPPSPGGSGQLGVWAPKSVHSVGSDAKETQVSEAGIKDDAELKGFSRPESDELKEQFAGTKPIVASGTTRTPSTQGREVVASTSKEILSTGPVEAIPAVPSGSSSSASFDFDVEFPPIPPSTVQNPLSTGNEAGSGGPSAGSGVLRSDLYKSAHLRGRKADRTEGTAHLAVDAQHPEVSNGQLLVGSVPIKLKVNDSGPREVAAWEISRILHPGREYATRSSIASVVNTGTRSSENPTAGWIQGPSGHWKGHVGGSVSVPSRTQGSTLGERTDARPTGMPLPGFERLAKQGWPTGANRSGTAKVWRAVGVVGDRQKLSNCGSVLGRDIFATNRDVHDDQEGPNAAGVATSVALSTKEPQPTTPEGQWVDSGSVEKEVDKEKELLAYCKMLEEFNRSRWEEAIREGGWVQDSDLVDSEGESEVESEVLSTPTNAIQGSLAGAGGQPSSRGNGSDDANEQALHGAGWSSGDRVGSCDDDRPTPDSQLVSQDNVDTNRGSTGNEGDSRRGASSGLDRRGEQSRGGSSGCVSGSVQGRKVYRMQAPFKYIPRRRVEGPVPRPDKT